MRRAEQPVGHVGPLAPDRPVVVTPRTREVQPRLETGTPLVLDSSYVPISASISARGEIHMTFASRDDIYRDWKANNGDYKKFDQGKYLKGGGGVKRGYGKYSTLDMKAVKTPGTNEVEDVSGGICQALSLRFM